MQRESRRSLLFGRKHLMLSEQTQLHNNQSCMGVNFCSVQSRSKDAHPFENQKSKSNIQMNAVCEETFRHIIHYSWLEIGKMNILVNINTRLNKLLLLLV